MARRKIFVNLTLFLLPVILLVLCLFICPLDRKQAYYFCNNDCYNKGIWNYDRLFHNPAAVDVAFIGSSRTCLGIMESAVEDGFEQVHLNANVANLAYCRWGRNMDHVTAQMLFANKKPKCIVVELHEEEERLGHIDFGYVADTHDVLMPVLFFDQNYFSDLYKALVVRFDILKHKILGDQKLAPVSDELHGYIHFNGVIDPNELDQMVKRDRERKHYEDSKAEAWINRQFPDAYLEKICALAKAHDCKIYFLYIPGYCSLPPKEGAFKYYEQYGTVLVTPPDILREKQNWRDGDHFNDSGAQKLSAWVAGQLAVWYKNK